jgi:transcriptional regulator with XRE-family HTH domain
MPINDQLRRAIARSGKTHYRIAKQSGISASTLSRFISGERELSMATAEKLCDSLGLELILRKRK